MTDKAEKTYSKGDLTVVWRADRCIHSAKCVAGLGAVFDPDRRPWIDLSAADAGQIIAQVDKCPSGALGWRRETAGALAGSADPAAAAATPPRAAVSLELVPDGPLIVRGEHAVGNEVRTGPIAYCRCGASNRKPYCDGSHARTGFKS